MGKTTEISWLHYFVPESRFPAGCSLPERVWLEHEPTTRMVKVLGATFNPWIGCAPAVHPSGVAASGCVQCYAAALNRRWRWNGTGTWGKGAPRKLASESTWKQAFGWARDAAKFGLRRRWFFSLGDPLDPEVPGAWQLRLWDFIRRTSHLDVLNTAASGEDWSGCSGGLDAYLLTKRPWLWEVIPEDVRPLIRLGTSASDQQSWDLWVGDLVKARGFAGLFVSLEPQVEAVDCGELLGGRWVRRDPLEDEMDLSKPCPRIDLVIQGGESGPKARPFRLEWARSVRDQCRAARVKYFFKQIGANAYDEPTCPDCPDGDVDGNPCKCAIRGGCDDCTGRLRFEDAAGADPSEWPEDLRIQEVP